MKKPLIPDNPAPPLTPNSSAHIDLSQDCFFRSHITGVSDNDPKCFLSFSYPFSGFSLLDMEKIAKCINHTIEEMRNNDING